MPSNPEGYTGAGRWVDAIDLRVGDVLLLRTGKQSAISNIEIRQDRLPVYNFHVEELECYAVGHIQVLVHNNSLEEAIARNMKVIRGKDAPDRMVEVMEKLNRPMSRDKIREVIHRVKDKNGVGAAEDLVFDHSGGIWDSRNGDYIQKMWE